MTNADIAALAAAIKERRLVSAVKVQARVERPTLSADTIGRAWKWSGDIECAPPAIRLVIRVAQNVLLRDDQRIREHAPEVLEAA